MDEMIFETHAHFDSRQFDEDRDEVLKMIHEGKALSYPSGADECTSGQAAAFEDRVPVGRIINVGADMNGSRASVELAHRYDFINAAVGIHPDEAGEIIFCDSNPEKSISREECTSNFEELHRLAGDGVTVAIGEIGLDYHWDIWPREIQKEAFIRQWDLADEFGFPIIIHSRDAAEDTMEIVKERFLRNGSAPLRAVMHCYSYSREHALEYLKMGLFFGIGGVVTFKNAKKLKEVVAELPMDRILLETDCPYMAPEPFRGKRNDSGKICYVAEMISQLKGISVEEVYKITYQNAVNFFTR